MPTLLHLNPIYVAQFEVAEERFKLMFTDIGSLLALVEAGLKVRFFYENNITDRLSLLEVGFFSLQLFESMICGGNSYSTAPIGFMWECLLRGKIVAPSLGDARGFVVDHELDKDRLRIHLQNNTFQNLFYPPSVLVDRYSKSVLSIDVEDRCGRTSRGTGFFVRLDEENITAIVTCRHNVDYDEGISIKNISDKSGLSIQFCSPVMSGDYDIACIPILDNQKVEPTFRLSEEAAIFDEVFTLGYPLVPCAEPMLLGHRGEINGTANLYIEKSPAVIISNLVSPGSSGGPVLSRDGRCIGMTMRWLTGQWDNETIRFSAALPASLIRAFLLNYATLEKSASGQ